MTTPKNLHFASLFKKYRLRSGFSTLKELADYLSQEGLIYDDSLLSRWQNGTRTPKDRTVILKLIEVFVKKGGIKKVEEADEWLNSADQRSLNNEEIFIYSKYFQKKIFMVPPSPDFFVERQEYLEKASWYLLNKKSVLLYGLAGNGKTYLAIKLAHLLKENFSDGILWYRLDTSDWDDILESIANNFGEDISKIKDKDLKMKIINDLLNKKDILLIFDNVEKFDEIKSFLDKKNQFPLLLTAKYLPKESLNLHKIEITGFKRFEFLKLAKKILGQPYVLINKKKIEEFGEKINYSPLASTILLRQIEKNPERLNDYLSSFIKEEKVFYTTKYDGKTLEESIDFCYQILEPKVKKFFLSLGVFFGMDFSFEAVSFLNNSSFEESKKIINQLKNFSLIETSFSGRYRIHPLIRSFIQKRLDDKKIYQKLALFFIKKLSNYPRATGENYQIIEKDLDNLLGVFEKCYQYKFFKEVIDLWDFLGVFLWDKGDWKKIKIYKKIIIKSCIKTNNKKALANFYLRELSWLYYWTGNLNEAEKLAKMGEQIAKRLNDKQLLALSQIRLGKIYESKNQPKIALKLLKKAFNFFKAIENKEKQGDILTYIGEVYWQMNQVAKAKRTLNHALRIVRQINDLPQKETILARLGCIALYEREFKKAAIYLKKSLFIRKQIGYRLGDFFWGNLGLGLFYWIKKEVKNAKEKFKLAKKEMKLVGYTKRTLLIDVFPLMFQKELKEAKVI